MPWSLLQRTLVPSSKSFQLVSVHMRSCGIVQGMKGKKTLAVKCNSCSTSCQYSWQALRVSCKWLGDKIKNFVPQTWGVSCDGVHICRRLIKWKLSKVFMSPLAFQHTVFTCKGFHGIMHNHNVHCIRVLLCAVNWETQKPGRITAFLSNGFVESAYPPPTLCEMAHHQIHKGPMANETLASH